MTGMQMPTAGVQNNPCASDSNTRWDSYPPRAMRSDRAAAYLDMSQSSFLRLVADKVFPPGFQIRGMTMWDRYDLDTSFENIKVSKRPEPRNSINELLGITHEPETCER